MKNKTITKLNTKRMGLGFIPINKRLLAICSMVIFSAGSLWAQAPSNNDCSAAIDLTIGADCTTGTNLNANSDTLTDVDSCNSGNDWASVPDHTVWYKFSTGSAGSYTITTDNIGTDEDTQLKLLKGSCTSWDTIICDEDDGICQAGGLAAEITATLEASTVYYIMVDIWNTDQGRFCISVNFNDEMLNYDHVDFADNFNSNISNVTRNAPFNQELFNYKNISQDVIQIAGDDYTGCGNPALQESGVYFGTWHEFTYKSDSNTWLSVYPANTDACDESEDIFYTLHLFKGNPEIISSSNNVDVITGLTSLGCSIADGLRNDAGNRDKAAGSLNTIPRIDLSNLELNDLEEDSVYYVFVAQMTRATVNFVEDTAFTGVDTIFFPVPDPNSPDANPSIGKYYLTLEAASDDNVGIDDTSADICAETNDLTLGTTYSNLSNAGMEGNIWLGNTGTNSNVPSPDEPLEYDLINSGRGYDRNCTNNGVVQGTYQGFNHNSALYTFEVEESGFDPNQVCVSGDSAQILILELFDVLCDTLIEFYPRLLPPVLDPLTGDTTLPVGDILAGILGDTVAIIDGNTCATIRGELELILAPLSLVPEVCIPVNCSPHVEISLENIQVGGIAGANSEGHLVAVLDSCNGAVGGLWGTVNDTTTSLCLRSTLTPFTEGTYTLVVEGNEELISYNLTVNVIYRLGLGGVECTIAPPPAQIKLENNSFMLDYVSPVPATNNIELSFVTSSEGNAEFEVFNINGQKVYSANIDASKGQNIHNLNIESYNAGIYMLKITKGGQQIHSKFIKVN
ncbi:MAG: hypothetical protein ACJAZ3_000787 [Sphingobacteriales bacterium]|jgi:hypothetical protein